MSNIKVLLTTDEWYPVYVLYSDPIYTPDKDISIELYEEYNRAMDNFSAVQEKLRIIYYNKYGE